MGVCSCSFAHGIRVASLGMFAAMTVATACPQSSNLPLAVARRGTSLGLESPSAPVHATVWLKMHDRAEFDREVKQLYTKGSPTYHMWMTPSELGRFQPTGEEIAAVKAELTAHHLTIRSVDAMNYSVKFEGTAADYEGAFHTQISRYRLGSRVVRVASATPQMNGAAAGLVSAVTGLSEAGLHPFHAVPLDPKTGRQLGKVAVTANVKPQGALFSNQCLGAMATVYLTLGTSTATYSGISYGADPDNSYPGTIAPCGYSPQDVWRLYSLNSVYDLGYTGGGQTVVVVDAYGSPTILEDLTTFSSLYALTAPTSANFQVYEPQSVVGSDSGWALETTLDVEWAHAIAPDANIALIATPSPADDDLQTAVMFAVNNHLGNVISNSYGEPETEVDPLTMLVWDGICELAAAQGISVHFATGDEGDYAAQLGYADVSTPANAPHATSVGGTSIVFSPFDGSVIQTGWGTNLTELSPGNYLVDDPPVALGFQGGAGGGVSQFFSKPDYQAALPGPGKHLPDISAIADEHTGVEVIFTLDGQQYFELVGGTSLATPVFSSIWALFDQYNLSSLGQAGPYIAAGSPFFVDVLPVADTYNVTGSIGDVVGTTYYSSASLSEPLEATTMFGSALWNNGGGTFYNLTFGTDSSLTVTPGWDNVTGYGTPNFAAVAY